MSYLINQLITTLFEEQTGSPGLLNVFKIKKKIGTGSY